MAPFLLGSSLLANSPPTIAPVRRPRRQLP